MTTFESSPIKLNLDFLNGIEVKSSKKEESNVQEESDGKLPDYNYLME